SVANGQLVRTITGHGDGVAFVGYLADGRMVTASLDRTVKVWRDGSPQATMSGHQDYLTCAAVARTGPLVASGGFDKMVRLWDAQSGAALAALSGHQGPVQAVAISSSSRIVASGSDDRSVRLWDAKTMHPLRTLDAHELTVEALAFSSG